MVRKYWLFLFLALLTSAFSVSAQDSLNVRTLAKWKLWQYANDVAVQGSYAYLAVNSGIQVMYISNPETPVDIGGSPEGSPGECHTIAAHGAVAVAGKQQPGLYTIDLSNPTCPTQIAFLDSVGPFKKLIIRGNYAIGMLSNAIQVINIADPTHPRAEWTIAYSQPILDFDASLSRIYAVEVSWIHIYDFSNPDTLTELNIYQTTWNIQRIALSEPFLYVNTGASIRVVDVSNPLQPVPRGSCPNTRPCFAMTYGNGYLYVNGVALSVVDVSNPAAPRMLGSCTVVCTSRNFAMTPGFIMMCRRGDFVVCSVEPPSAPSEVTALRGWWSPADATIAADNVYCVDQYGLHVLNVANPSAPVCTGGFLNGSTPSAVAAAGDLCFISSRVDCLRIVDVSVPARPELRSIIPCYAVRTAISGNFACVAAGNEGFRMFDISNPESPAETDSIRLPQGANDVAVAGDYACVATYDSGVYIVRIADPFDLTVAGHWKGPEQIRSIAAGNNLLCVTSWDSGFSVVDISVPESPLTIGVRSEYTSSKVVMAGNYALTNSPELLIWDLTCPANPQIVGRHPLQGTTSLLAAAGNRIITGENGYVGVYENFDLGQIPLAPRELLMVPDYESNTLRLAWRAVITDTSGCPLPNITRYVILQSPDWAAAGDSIGYCLPPDTSYVIDSASVGMQGFYSVKAVTE